MTDGKSSVQVIADGLKTLNRAELEELDAIITPRAAILLTKAFGDGFGAILGPLTENDGTDGAPAGDAAGGAAWDAAGAEADLRAMMQDPRYWRDRDPRTVQQVADGFRKLYPGEVQATA
ncbi:hypothetical protein HH303_15335 [Rhodospirillaceae bacterium KN72]|uniref:Uncharacterized protein n=1 Tax=Pacificispira spongiicola TaxID=2729598 RepID=A0A7Y0E284_9PROT|nr:hypothetical protein [Pacificispira spongiicola]NMM45869.1 hypothetical protein [Pacificispira spongiicola]